MYMKRGGPTPFFPKISRKLDVRMGKMEKKVYQKKGKQVFVLANWRFIIKVLCIKTRFFVYNSVCLGYDS